MFPAIRIASITMSTFIVTLLVGTIGMLICTLKRRLKYALTLLSSVLFTSFLTAVGVAGSKLLFALENGFNTWNGVSFYGSVFLIPIVMPLIGLLFNQRPKHAMDLCAPCVAIMIGCLRIGCFLTGCCGGWQMCIGSFCFSWPTQAMDSIGDFIIFAWLLQLEENGKANGRLYPLFMVSYSIMRFFIEFLRDTPKDWLCLSHGQWFALAAIAVGFIWLTVQKRRSNEHVS